MSGMMLLKICTYFLNIETIFEAIGGMMNTTLETLILDGTRMFRNGQSQQFCDPRLKNLQRLSLRGTVLSHKLSFQQNRQPRMSSLNHINLGVNPINNLVYYSAVDSNYARFVFNMGLSPNVFWSLSNVRTVDCYIPRVRSP